MHAEKYFAHEAPVKVGVPDLSRALGAGWRRIDTDVNGEWGYYQILDQFLNDEKTSRQAAAGWGGDRYALYENQQTHETLLAQATTWDTEQDAREFADAYSKRTDLRYKTEPDAGHLDTDPMRMTWHTPEGVVVIERRGSHIAILEGLPTNMGADKLMQLLATTH
jgi:hypothetical protein